MLCIIHIGDNEAGGKKNQGISSNADISRATVNLISEHHNKVNMAIKRVKWIFWFLSVFKSYVYT